MFALQESQTECVLNARLCPFYSWAKHAIKWDRLLSLMCHSTSAWVSVACVLCIVVGWLSRMTVASVVIECAKSVCWMCRNECICVSISFVWVWSVACADHCGWNYRKNCWMRRKRWMNRLLTFECECVCVFLTFCMRLLFLHDDLWINDFNSFCMFITYNFICFLCSFILTYFYFFFSNSRVTILFICFNAVLSFCLTIYVPCCRLFVYKCVNVVVFVCMPLIFICVDILYQQ